MRSERSKKGESGRKPRSFTRDEGVAYFRATNAFLAERRDKALCAAQRSRMDKRKTSRSVGVER